MRESEIRMHEDVDGDVAVIRVLPDMTVFEERVEVDFGDCTSMTYTPEQAVILANRLRDAARDCRKFERQRRRARLDRGLED